jgi:hypothetical protein
MHGMSMIPSTRRAVIPTTVYCHHLVVPFKITNESECQTAAQRQNYMFRPLHSSHGL